MGNVNMPTPVALAGGAICVLGGYLLGVLAGPASGQQTTATVVSYDGGSHRLCLEGDGVSGQDGRVVNGVLCGNWRITDGATVPKPGDEFKFVSLSPNSGDGHTPVTWIYGDVVSPGR
jgi:hypothetical protein